jgi:hypothetical protein
VIRDIKNDKQLKKMQLGHANYKLVKLNHTNENQFYISSDDKFLIYDLRTFQQLDNIDEFKGCIDIFNDSQIFLVNNGVLRLYKQTKLINDFGLSELTHLNCNIQGYNNPDSIIAGNSNGDLYYSTIE